MAKTILAIGVKPDEDESKGVTIPLPEGFTPPDGVEDGDTFQVMADVRMVDGKLLIEKLDGKEVSEEETPEKEEDAPPTKSTLMGTYKDLMKGAK